MVTRWATVGFGLWLIALGGSAQDRQEIPKDVIPFQGSWKVIEATRGGVAAPKELVAEMKLQFEGTKLTVFEKKSAENGQFVVSSHKTPPEIDMISAKPDPSTGQIVKSLGIYQFDKDGKLVIVFHKGSAAERPKTFDEKTATRLVLEKMKE
ncbi:MAG: TIGR03067 domain-containing protein [Gemmataceae bacterium]|nr:TIGR03067 domain-containing protein [Gemmata sp.]MDW8197015.1 TIGR03067 domain-containing protein [Gemmataceae bacterium]